MDSFLKLKNENLKKMTTELQVFPQFILYSELEVNQLNSPNLSSSKEISIQGFIGAEPSCPNSGGLARACSKLENLGDCCHCHIVTAKPQP